MPCWMRLRICRAHRCQPLFSNRRSFLRVYRDTRLALYLTDHLPRLRHPSAPQDLSPRERAIVDHLDSYGASFFAVLHEAAGGGYPGETVDALWDLVWKGILTN